MHLLTSFLRGFVAKERNEHGEVVEVIRTEYVRCRIWVEDIDAFMRKHAPIPAPTPAFSKKEKWMPYMTVSKDDMGVK